MSGKSKLVKCNEEGDRIKSEDAVALASQLLSCKNLEVLYFHLKPFPEKLGYLGFHELLTIEARKINDDTSKRKLTFFVKSVIPDSDEFDQMIFKIESKFFHDVVPKLLDNLKIEPWAAECYLIRNNSMVLEDLQSQGYKCIEQLELNHSRLALNTISRFHASSILLEEKLQKPLNNVYPGLFEQKVFLYEDGLVWKWLATGIEVMEAVANNLNLNSKYISMAYDMMLNEIKLVEGQRNVLCHNDLWSNNIMFNATSCKLIDFQTVAYCHYIVDLLQFIYLNISKETRRKSEKEFIELYHSVLHENLRNNGFDESKIISLKEISRDFEKKRIIGLVTAVQYFPMTLMNKKMIEEYTKDPVKMKEYQYTSRRDFILKGMQLDMKFKNRIEEIVIELVEFMDKIVV